VIEMGWPYTAESKRLSTGQKSWSSGRTQQRANENAIGSCGGYSDCVLTRIGLTLTSHGQQEKDKLKEERKRLAAEKKSCRRKKTS